MVWNPTVRSTKDFATSWVSLFYGAGKSGKTTLLRDCDLIINTLGEDGLSSLSNLDIPIIDATNTIMPDDIFHYLRDSELGKKSTKIGIDSFSWLINKLFLKKVLGNRKTRTWGDWDVLADWTDEFITNLKTLKKDIICTALEQLVKNELSGITKGYPDIGTRNYQQGVASRFDICAHVTGNIQGVKKVITVDLDDVGMYIAGVRTPMREGIKYTFDATQLTAMDIHRMLQGTKEKN